MGSDYCVHLDGTENDFLRRIKRVQILVNGVKEWYGVCRVCVKPTRLSAHYLQYCGDCLSWYRGVPESDACQECMQLAEG